MYGNIFRVVSSGATKENTYEIIVVDNNSSNEPREWLKDQKDIATILNDENVGFFPQGCNIGITTSIKENDILFLNNVTVANPKWLDNLKICLYSSDKIGATASITNNCSVCFLTFEII